MYVSVCRNCKVVTVLPQFAATSCAPPFLSSVITLNTLIPLLPSSQSPVLEQSRRLFYVEFDSKYQRSEGLKFGRVGKRKHVFFHHDQLSHPAAR